MSRGGAGLAGGVHERDDVVRRGAQRALDGVAARADADRLVARAGGVDPHERGVQAAQRRARVARAGVAAVPARRRPTASRRPGNRRPVHRSHALSGQSLWAVHTRQLCVSGSRARLRVGAQARDTQAAGLVHTAPPARAPRSRAARSRSRPRRRSRAGSRDRPGRRRRRRWRRSRRHLWLISPVVGSRLVLASLVEVSPSSFTQTLEAQTRPPSHDLPVVQGQLRLPTGHSAPLLLLLAVSPSVSP